MTRNRHEWWSVARGAGLVLGLLLLSTGCATFGPPRPPSAWQGRHVAMEVTGYCSCQTCCGWKRNWLGRPVFTSGPNRGKHKDVGVCADGTRAERGTVAADTRYYPFATRLYVPGYGYGTVHDRGSGIQGPTRLDLYFPTHEEALAWGRRRVVVVVLAY